MLRIPGIAMLLVLASAGANAANPPPTPQARAANEGYVVAPSHDTALVSVFFTQLDQITVQAEEGKDKTYTFMASHPLWSLGTVQSTLSFGAWLPPGKYSVTALGARQGAMSTGADVRDSRAASEITAGQVTDLGLIILQRIPTGTLIANNRLAGLLMDSNAGYANRRATPESREQPHGLGIRRCRILCLYRRLPAVGQQ